MSGRYSQLTSRAVVTRRPHDPNDGTGEQTRQRLVDYRVEHHRLVDYRVEQLETAVGQIRDAIQSIDKSLQVLAVADMQHAQTREGLGKVLRQIEGLGKRLQTVEMELPTMRLIRHWVITGVVGVLGSVGAAALALVLR